MKEPGVRSGKCTRFFVAALSKTGSTAKVASRHKEPIELNRLSMGFESEI
jgi:hypothetical protein